MKSLFSYLITFCAVLYWIFRVAVSLMYAMGKDFICQPLNANLEILILFLTIPSIVFVIRRNLIATTLYFAMYGAYFGTILYNSLTGTLDADGGLSFTDTTSILFTAIGVIIPFLIFLDVFIQRNRFSPKDRETDWFYNNEQFDRQMDDRADKNQYKIK